jgi:hypothetical protein
MILEVGFVEQVEFEVFRIWCNAKQGDITDHN